METPIYRIPDPLERCKARDPLEGRLLAWLELRRVAKRGIRAEFGPRVRGDTRRKCEQRILGFRGGSLLALARNFRNALIRRGTYLRGEIRGWPPLVTGSSILSRRRLCCLAAGMDCRGGEGRASFSWRRSGQILRLRDVEFARFPLIESLSRPDYTGSRGNKPLRGIALSAAGLFATESAVNTAGQNANYSAANLADRI